MLTLMSLHLIHEILKLLYWLFFVFQLPLYLRLFFNVRTTLFVFKISVVSQERGEYFYWALFLSHFLIKKEYYTLHVGKILFPALKVT